MIGDRIEALAPGTVFTLHNKPDDRCWYLREVTRVCQIYSCDRAWADIPTATIAQWVTALTMHVYDEDQSAKIVALHALGVKELPDEIA